MDNLALATVLALASAGLHAGWNLLVKTADDRELTAWGQYVFGGLMFVPVLIVIGPPGWTATPYIAASSVVHVVYTFALVRAYHHGDFSFAYPISRGTGAVIAAIGGVIFLGDHLPPLAWVAIAIAAAGLVSLVDRSITAITIGWALLTASMIGSYTTIDSAGARATESGFSYGVVLTIAAAATLTAAGTAQGRLRDFVESIPHSWRRYMVAGFCLTLAYSLVLLAVEYAPVGYVAMLRESSVVLGALLGWLFLNEQLGGRRMLSSIVVASALVMLVIVR
jgi:drug/metabolite transporter (DMT)-like permease